MNACIFANIEDCNEALKKICFMKNNWFCDDYINGYRGRKFVLYINDYKFVGYDLTEIVGTSFEQIVEYYKRKFETRPPIYSNYVKNIYYSKKQLLMETE